MFIVLLRNLVYGTRCSVYEARSAPLCRPSNEIRIHLKYRKAPHDRSALRGVTVRHAFVEHRMLLSIYGYCIYEYECRDLIHSLLASKKHRVWLASSFILDQLS